MSTPEATISDPEKIKITTDLCSFKIWIVCEHEELVEYGYEYSY